MRNSAWILRSREDRTAEDVLSYFRQLNFEQRDDYRFNPSERSEPKYDLLDLFLPKVIEEAKELGLKKNIESLEHEIAELREYIIPKREKELEELKQRLVRCARK